MTAVQYLLLRRLRIPILVASILVAGFARSALADETFVSIGSGEMTALY
jgi:hypothetical protein